MKSGEKSHIAEIDTLRATAVLLVLIFHAFPSALPGGFIGVDVFFTVSGFVISRSYLYPLVRREISLSDFYLARFRRLAPAALLVLLVTTLIASSIVLPDHLVNFANSLMAQPAYLQNLVFWVEGDYFSGALTKPLLHTWSLAVEEQFYILWALLILFLRRYPALILVTTLAGGMLSLGLGYLLEPRSPKTVFYLLPTRIWEFAIGIMAYLWVAKRGKIPGPLPAVAISSSLATIILVALTLDEKSPFPGTQSMLACLATGVALYFMARIESSTRFLTLGPVRYIGKISYGLYLWHWPPLAIFFLATGRPADTSEAALLLLLAFAAAVASFHWLEQPVRRGTTFRTARKVYSMVGIGCVATAAAGATIVGTNGFLSRYPKELQPLLAAPHERGQFRCGQAFVMLNPTAEMCPLTNSASAGGVLVLGDSHADVLKEMLGRVGDSLNTPVYLTTRNCDLGRYGSYGFCSDSILRTIMAQAQAKGIRDVLAISYWETDKFDENSLSEDLSIISGSGLRTHLMQVVPNHSSYDPKTRASSALTGKGLKLDGISRDQYLSLTTREREIFQAAKLAFPDQFFILDPSSHLCPEGRCLWNTDGVPNYLDSNHLTFTGTELLAPMFRDLFHKIKLGA